MKERIQAQHSPTRCPYCRDEISGTKDLVACAACGARHHEGCHREQGACASCGSAEALYPRTSSQTAAGPPEGSRIRVMSEGEETRYSWHLGSSQDWVLLGLLSVLLLPLAPVFLVWGVLRTQKTRSITVRPDAIELPSRTFWGEKRVHIPREQLGMVRVDRNQGGWVLAADAGLQRHLLVVDSLSGCSLTGPELEWLAERLRAWKTQG